MLNRVEFITVREPISLQVIQSLNVKTPTSLTADPAFLLNHSSPEHGKALLVEADIPINNKILIIILIRKRDRNSKSMENKCRLKKVNGLERWSKIKKKQEFIKSRNEYIHDDLVNQ